MTKPLLRIFLAVTIALLAFVVIVIVHETQPLSWPDAAFRVGSER